MHRSAQVKDLAGPDRQSPLLVGDRTGTASDGARFHIDRTMIDGFVVRDLERHGLPDAGRR